MRNRLRSPAPPWASRVLAVLSILVALAVTAVTVPRLPEFSPWPALLGLVPWTIGKYVLCPIRWYAISDSGRSMRWHLTSFAESEVFGLLTPGHIGADIWRMRRLRQTGMPRLAAAADVGLDRFVGAIGLVLFISFAATTLPLQMVLVSFVGGLVALLAALLVHRLRPDWLPRRRLPPLGRLIHGLALSVAYQASIIALLVGTLLATGYHLSPLGVLGAFGASQLAAAVPGPNGASPRDGALAVALNALGVPWAAALGAVTLKALLAWGPAVILGGGCLLLAHRRGGLPGRSADVSHSAAPAALLACPVTPVCPVTPATT
ncbi:MAG TPA: lysylphosphatidylglycerol synthase domain-containing protein [Kineosporiaceae bacterium]|nr:lysylphosphatidylglycerol synthase domain-containing protein [Kineosporiaceae bacterium]